jgi:hypothetical protein
MDEATRAFVDRQNIVHYVELLKTETDPAKRGTIVRLLTDEQTKQKVSAESEKKKT